MSPSMSTHNATLTLNGTTVPLSNFTISATQAAAAMQSFGNAYVTAPAVTPSNYTITATTPVQWQWQQPTYQQSYYASTPTQWGTPVRDDGAGYRQPPPRAFNKYLNGSDLLEEFIAFLGIEGVRADEFMTLPVELFVKWLIIRACEQDQEEPNVTLELPSPTPRRHGARCLGCGRYMRSAPVALHEPCAPRYFNRQLEAA